MRKLTDVYWENGGSKTRRRDSGGQEGRMGGIVVRKVGGMDSFCCSVRKIRKSDFGREDNFGSMIN
jgi:hypothetical protein